MEKGKVLFYSLHNPPPACPRQQKGQGYLIWGVRLLSKPCWAMMSQMVQCSLEPNNIREREGKGEWLQLARAAEEGSGSCLTWGQAQVPLRLMGSAEVRWTLKGLCRNWAQMEEWAWSEGGCWAEMPDLDGHNVQHSETGMETIPFGITPLWFIHQRCVSLG